MKKCKTKSDLINHPAVESIHKEDDGCFESSLGIWLYAKPGYKFHASECGTLHEATIKELCNQFNMGFIRTESAK